MSQPEEVPFEQGLKRAPRIYLRRLMVLLPVLALALICTVADQTSRGFVLTVLSLPVTFLMGVRYGLILQREKLEQIQVAVRQLTEAANDATRTANEWRERCRVLEHGN